MKSRARGSVSSSGPVGPVSLRVFVPLRSPRRASLRSYSSTPSTSASSSCTACSTAARTCWWIRTPRENFSSCTSFSFLIALPTARSSGRRLGRRRVGGFPTGRMRHFHFPHHPGRDRGTWRRSFARSRRTPTAAFPTTAVSRSKMCYGIWASSCPTRRSPAGWKRTCPVWT